MKVGGHKFHRKIENQKVVRSLKVNGPWFLTFGRVFSGESFVSNMYFHLIWPPILDSVVFGFFLHWFPLTSLCINTISNLINYVCTCTDILSTYLVFLNECERCVVLNQIKVRLERPLIWYKHRDFLVFPWIWIVLPWSMSSCRSLCTCKLRVIQYGQVCYCNPAKVVPPFHQWECVFSK